MQLANLRAGATARAGRSGNDAAAELAALPRVAESRRTHRGGGAIDIARASATAADGASTGADGHYQHQEEAEGEAAVPVSVAGML